ncbi:protein of unknown function [Methylorubrum extorquens]|uniref:Uncharacterized protein n=1 Tax=Methylorubrum extorquens TaxID=408 RepID=A0A2N9AH23_METEX|nr:protein of unknown function [Methylorubrum extorquens]
MPGSFAHETVSAVGFLTARAMCPPNTQHLSQQVRRYLVGSDGTASSCPREKAQRKQRV